MLVRLLLIINLASPCAYASLRCVDIFSKNQVTPALYELEITPQYRDEVSKLKISEATGNQIISVPTTKYSNNSGRFEAQPDVPITEPGTYFYVAIRSGGSERITFKIIPQGPTESGMSTHRIIAKTIIDYRREEIRERVKDYEVSRDEALTYFEKNGFWEQVVGAGEIVVERPRKKLLLKDFNNRSGTYAPGSIHLEASLEAFLKYWNADTTGQLGISQKFTSADYSRTDKNHPNYIENPYEDVLHTIRYVELLGPDIFARVLREARDKDDFNKRLLTILPDVKASSAPRNTEIDLSSANTSSTPRRNIGRRPKLSNVRPLSIWQKGNWNESKLLRYLKSKENLEATEGLNAGSGEIRIEKAIQELNSLKEEGFLFASVQDFLSSFVRDPKFRTGMEFRLNVTYVEIVISINNAGKSYPGRFLFFDASAVREFLESSSGVGYQSSTGDYHTSLLKFAHENFGGTLRELRSGLIVQKLAEDGHVTYWDLPKPQYRKMETLELGDLQGSPERFPFSR